MTALMNVYYRKSAALVFTRRNEYLYKNLGFKEGGGCLLKGGVFSGTYGM